IRGISFRTADQIAGRLGIEKTALIRVRAGISYALAEAMDDGHCGLPAEELIALTRELLEVPAELVETALSLELQGGAVIADDLEGRRCVFLAGLYRAEREIAEKLKALAVGKPSWPFIDADRAIPWVEKGEKFALGKEPEGALPGPVRVEGGGFSRGPGRWQDAAGHLAPKVLGCKARRNSALRADGAGRQTPVREYRARGEDHPPPA